MKAKLYTAAELEQKAGVNPGTLRNLVALGLPVAKKKKSCRGKPSNLYDAGAVYDWWSKKHMAGKMNWGALANLDRLGKLSGRRKQTKPKTDAEMQALGFDPASMRAAEDALASLANVEMPEMKIPEIEMPDFKPEDFVIAPAEMTKEEAEAAFNIRIVEKKQT